MSKHHPDHNGSAEEFIAAKKVIDAKRAGRGNQEATLMGLAALREALTADAVILGRDRLREAGAPVEHH